MSLFCVHFVKLEKTFTHLLIFGADNMGLHQLVLLPDWFLSPVLRPSVEVVLRVRTVILLYKSYVLWLAIVPCWWYFIGLSSVWAPWFFQILLQMCTSFGIIKFLDHSKFLQVYDCASFMKSFKRKEYFSCVTRLCPFWSYTYFTWCCVQNSHCNFVEHIFFYIPPNHFVRV